MENPSSRQTKKELTSKYNKALAEVVFPSYKHLLEKHSNELDDFYKDAKWYNQKERNIMLYDFLDDALLSLKMYLWEFYHSSNETVKGENDE